MESVERNEGQGLGYLNYAVEADEHTTSNSQHRQYQQLGESADWNWGKDKANKVWHMGAADMNGGCPVWNCGLNGDGGVGGGGEVGTGVLLEPSVQSRLTH